MSEPLDQAGELERRIALLEDPANQGAEFDGTTWVSLILLGVVLPAVVFAWGWW